MWPRGKRRGQETDRKKRRANELHHEEKISASKNNSNQELRPTIPSLGKCLQESAKLKFDGTYWHMDTSRYVLRMFLDLRNCERPIGHSCSELHTMEISSSCVSSTPICLLAPNLKLFVLTIDSFNHDHDHNHDHN